MTAPVAFVDIERLLRQPAPDEPAILPALVLPTDAWSVRGRVAPGSRGRQLRTIRPAYAAVALLLLLATVIAAGALRIFDKSREELADGCVVDLPVPAGAAGAPCLSVAVPEGWTVLGSGQLFPGNFTEPGIGYEYVELVMASAPLEGCASPGGPPPTAIPAGTNSFDVPAPTPDAGLACLRTAVLPPNGVRVVTMKGTRITGLAPGGYGIPDTSEPTAEAGWTEEVAGRPARLTVTSGGPGSVAETRTWDVLVPGSIDAVYRIRADIAGPDVEAGRDAVQALIDTVRFPGTAPEIDPTKANEALRATLDALDQQARLLQSDLYSCFPRESGSASATIVGGPGGPLAAPLDVTCRSEVSASRAGVFRIVLDVSWPAGNGYEADTIRTEFFSFWMTSDLWPAYSGGYATSLSGRPTPESGLQGWFPATGYDLPAPLDGPLGLTPGTFATMLWPGEGAVPAPGGADDSYYPTMVGTHVYVLEGPEVVDGEEWYRVEHEEGGYPGVGWIRGTRDGRPQLRPIEPDCPSGESSVGDVMWLIAAERVHCFGRGELRLEGVLVAAEDQGPMECVFDTGDPTTCPGFPGEPAWLTGPAAWKLYGTGGEHGPEPPLEVWLDPSIEAPEDGAVVRVRGHFDDRAAAGCQGPTEEGAADDWIVDQRTCRERFVITAIESR